MHKIRLNKQVIHSTRVFFFVLLSYFLISAFSLPTASAGVTIGRPTNSAGTLNNGLVGYWTFDGKDTPWTSATAATTNDLSGNNNTGTLTNMNQRSSVVPGVAGQGLKFDGVDDYVAVGSSASFVPTTWTISAWVYLNATSPNVYGVFAVSDATAWSRYFRINNSVVEGGYYTGTGENKATGGTLTAGRWYFLVYTFNGTNSYIYTDGVAGSPTAVTGSVSTTARPTTIGGGWAGVATEWPIKGRIDDVRIYNRALSVSEIKQLYNMGGSKLATSQTNTAGTLKDGLVGYWTFDGKDTPWTSATAATTLDKSGNGNTGTLTNMNQRSSVVPGIAGQGLSFDGVDDYVDAGSNSSLAVEGASFSISTWIKLSTLPASTYGYLILSKSPNNFSGSGYGLLYGTNYPSYAPVTGFNLFKAGIKDQPIAYTMSTGVWVHIVAVQSASSWQLFINGSSIGTFSNSDAYQSSAGRNLRIAGDSTYPYVKPIDGLIDDVRIYNRALSASEIKQLYNMGGSKLATSQVNTAGTLKSGLVGYWTFDGKDTPWTSATAATTRDLSGNNNTGTLTNMNQRSSVVPGVAGQGLNFDGVDDYVMISDNDSLDFGTGNMSVCAWVKTSSAFNDSRNIFDKDMPEVGNPSYLLYIDGGNARFILGTSGGDYVAVSSTNVNDQQWHYICATRNSGSANGVKIYIDGIQNGSMATDNGGTVSNAEDVYIGRFDGASGAFPGLIDDVRIYNRALSASEVKQLYNMGR